MDTTSDSSNEAHSILPSLPPATQAQIIRSNQKDLQHITQLREQISDVVRNYFGSRWLHRRDAEVELATNVLYSTVTSLRATQTLGEEYVGMWAYDSTTRSLPSRKLRAILVLLPMLPSYISSKLNSQISGGSLLGAYLRALPIAIEVAVEVNLALFYLTGTYYNLTKRVLGVRHVSSTLPDPNARPPSYSFLGILMCIRLLHRLYTLLDKQLKSLEPPPPVQPTNALTLSDSQPLLIPRDTDIQQHRYIDSRRVTEILQKQAESSEITPDAETDEFTSLYVAGIHPGLRAGRRCALCLEERTATTSTECGHLFCWSCIVGWGDEKAECPLCRQSLKTTRLLPVYNL
ncbi:Peroxisome biogenesis factor 10 [Rhizoctonia solani]|uniref:RING-type E3 ubiquitin transferase n=1 Tax=Rhizoctonia solani TaxID=456999 RepID=A0A0K6G1Y5_9AGAM|nr:Peroxisome biogenesis factor 10 [Rhizoctonia solani]